ncbi:glycogen synthase GlgA [Verticiella sediminum]|nr:glycogen synthase GlgA [Verticiella sediminum]
MLKVLVVASEALPLAKTGGLGDAVSGMARAMREAGLDVTLLLPAYRGTHRHLTDTRTLCELHHLPGGPASLVAGRLASFDLPVLLLRNDALYDRDGSPYIDARGEEHPDNGVRFAALAHAATRIAAGRTPWAVPHVVHANDWHAGLVPLLMRAAKVRRVKSVLTIHNLAFQGLYPMHDAARYGIPAEYCGLDGCEFWGRINFMKAGIRYADRVTTVSHTYAREILTPAFGHGLDGLLRERQAQLVGIPNGIDESIWNPAIDQHLPDVYSADDLRGKPSCKRALQESFGLIADPQATVLVSGSRLTPQKMADVAVRVLPDVLDAHGQLQVAILGCGDRAIEDEARALAARYPGRVAAHIGYDEQLAHLLHAGGDILLHGSRFEPFGLTPIYAMRYGTLPVCSRVGGMADTVRDPGEHADDLDLADATGLLFDGAEAAHLRHAIERALRLYARKDLWRAMQRSAMTADHGWSASAGRYIDLYRHLAPPLAAARSETTAIAVPAPEPAAASTPAHALWPRVAAPVMGAACA